MGCSIHVSNQYGEVIPIVSNGIVQVVLGTIGLIRHPFHFLHREPQPLLHLLWRRVLAEAREVRQLLSKGLPGESIIGDVQSVREAALFGFEPFPFQPQGVRLLREQVSDGFATPHEVFYELTPVALTP